MDQENVQFYIPIRKSQINYYRKVPLYYKTTEDSYALYKPAGKMMLKPANLAVKFLKNSVTA